MAKRNVELRETTVYVCVNATGYPFEFTASLRRKDAIKRWNQYGFNFEKARKENGVQVVKAKLVPFEAQTPADGRQ